MSLDEPIRHSNGILTLPGHIIGTISDLGVPIPSTTEVRLQYRPQEHWLPRRQVLELSSEVTCIFGSCKAVVCRRAVGPDLVRSDFYVTGETLNRVLYHTLNLNGGPYPDTESEVQFSKWINFIELNMRIFDLYGRIVLSLPWILAWVITGPFFTACSFVITFKILRHEVAFDPPAVHVDMSRQTWVVGRTDRDLVGLFPAPSLSSPDTVPSQIGDVIVIFKEGARPYIIRKNGMSWKIIGNAYVHGIMYGAAFDQDQCVLIELS